MQQCLTLRRVNSTLRMSIPSEFVKERGLRHGDQVFWVEDETGVHLRFIRLADLAAQTVSPPAGG